VTLGRGPFRPWAGTGLGLMAIALGAGLGLAVYFR
jgi:hypothetical protein